MNVHNLMDMKLHESTSFADGTGDNKHYWRVLRVPGGWIYTMYNDICAEPIAYQFTATFIPFPIVKD